MTNLKPYITHYLANRPAFFAFIRPQEASLFAAIKKNYLTQPILDFGCGDGFFASQLFDPQEIQYGLDLNHSRIHQSDNFYKKRLTYDGQIIPLADQTVQSVISNCVLEHLPSLPVNLKEIHRILKPDGYFAATVMTDQWEPHLFGGKLFGQTYLKALRRRQDHLNLFSKTQWDQAFKQAGFSQVETIGYLHPTAVHFNELFHYLSLPALFSYHLTGRWVPFKSWYRPLPLVSLINQVVSADCGSTQKAAALFYLLKK